MPNPESANQQASTMHHLKKILDTFYREYDFETRLLHDPIQFPRRYRDPRDIEIAGFLASCFAYGRVDLFMPVVEKILSVMGKSPYDFLLHFDPGKRGKHVAGIYYRFNSTQDILCLLFMLRAILTERTSLENVFRKFYRSEDATIEYALAGLMGVFRGIDTSAIYGKNVKPPGLLQFFPSPADGSTCKRTNLFLRWMIRNRDIDLGIWKGIAKNRLVIPLDTHIARISRCLGLTGRRSQDWKMAAEITESLKRYDPADPLKYDFALCHHGISGVCREAGCRGCIFKPS
jgi:uncharacterized protein (TIGR02757 family)